MKIDVTLLNEQNNPEKNSRAFKWRWMRNSSKNIFRKFLLSKNLTYELFISTFCNFGHKIKWNGIFRNVKIWLCWFCPVFQKFCSQSENVVPFSTKTFQRTQTWIFNIMETTLRSSKGTYQNLGKWAHIISEIVLAFWLVLTYDLLEDRCMHRWHH